MDAAEQLADEVRDFINENEIIGIYLEPDSQRSYPYTSLASQVLGFVNADNVGAEGLEAAGLGHYVRLSHTTPGDGVLEAVAEMSGTFTAAEE